MESLVIELAKKYGMDKAMQMLGLDKQTQNPKYAISLGGRNINPLNMLTRAGLNKAFSGGLSGIMGPAALMGGAVMLGRAFDPTRPGSRNYNPNLAGQIKELNRRGMLNDRGQITSGPLKGKNLVSMFGTNDYGKMLQDRVDYFEDRITSGKNYSEKGYREAKNAAIEEAGIGVDIDGVSMSGADYQGETGNNTGGSKSSGGNKSGGFSSAERGASLHGAKGGLARYYRGGIASL
tara:strand:- start:43 stop:747 length:705 start_codon:yes stop_codon:yes gene_type:complete